MPYSETDIYFQQLMIETKVNVLEIIRQNGGQSGQDILLVKLDELTEKNPKLRDMARESYEDAWLFAFGALVQLMSEGVVGFDEAGEFYFLIPPDRGNG